MVCTYCGSATHVTNSRFQKRVNQTWRRRRCIKCDNDFTTLEIPELSNMIMVRVDDRKMLPFSRDKLFTSIYDCCKHREQAISDASYITKTIVSQVTKCLDNGLLDRNVIVDTVYTTLKRFDKTSAAIYKAYHSTKHPDL
jgi:transcriptional regulator NrdR family protein